MTQSAPTPLSIGQCAMLACQWEATAAKPGNVYRGADFGDMTFADMLAAAVAIGPKIAAAPDRPLGETILAAVEATQQSVAVNTNLGTILLLAPLAKSVGDSLRGEIDSVLSASTVDDARLAYQAIRLAAPGGLGDAETQDVSSEPGVTLQEAMALAADRDLIATQYTNRFADVFAAADSILGRVGKGAPLADAIVWEQLEQMARRPDTLVARKCGGDVARQSADRAAETLTSARMDGDLRMACAELDFWLRADGHRRNPGATADLIAAALFVLLVEGSLAWPVDFYGRRGARAPSAG